MSSHMPTVRADPMDPTRAISGVPGDHRMFRPGPWLPGITRDETDSATAYVPQVYDPPVATAYRHEDDDDQEAHR